MRKQRAGLIALLCITFASPRCNLGCDPAPLPRYTYKFNLSDFNLELDSVDASQGYSRCFAHLFIPVSPALGSKSRAIASQYSDATLQTDSSFWIINYNDSAFNTFRYSPAYPKSGLCGSTFDSSGLYISITGFENFTSDTSLIFKQLRTVLDSSWVEVSFSNPIDTTKSDIQ